MPDLRLVELEAEFLSLPKDRHWRRVTSIEDAAGVMFLCPVCFEANAGPVGTHRIMCWNSGVPDDCRPGPGRWDLEGTCLEDLTLIGGIRDGQRRSDSIQLTDEDGCRAHFWVRSGRIEPCG